VRPAPQAMSWSWLLPWRRGRRPDPPRVVVMYTRQGCHLCEQAWALLERLRRRHGFTLTATDVDTDPALAAEHGEHVPVVAVDGRVRFRGGVNPILLRRVFESKGHA
jgi:glutaredoxin